MNYTNNQIAEMVDEVLRLKEVQVCREIDAGACRTGRDMRRAHEAVEAFEVKYGELMDLLAAR